MKFPTSMTLNGADFFLLQLDHLMWKLGKQRNICTFAVALQERIRYQDLENRLAADLSYQWITRLRLQQGWPFLLAKWVLKSDVALPELNQYQIDDPDSLPADLFKIPFDIKVEAVFRVSLVQIANAGSILVFTWHHALMDAHGGETFIRHLGGLGKLSTDALCAQQENVLPLKEQANIALQMKEFLLDISRLPIASLANTKKLNAEVRYRILSYTEQQTKDITIRASQQGAGFLVSAFYLAVIACAVAKIQKKRAPMAEEDILIPIPLDRRKRGVHSPIIGNQVTFLFYRIPYKALANIKTCVAELVEQMKSLMRAENPRYYLVMMNFLRRVPGWLYRMQLTSPSEGKMASFYYSDTGDTLNLYDTLFDSQVTSAIHYPPNMYPPGITFVLSRSQDTLQLTFAYTQAVINEAEVKFLLQQINTGLLGKAED